MRIETVLTALGGAAPTHALYARGISRWEIARGVDEDRVIRVRRGILALADAPSDLVTAVSEHARLTCVSAARHYGL
ncbi:hypothetical protein [Arthrobacter sp. RIT-PI-e]|uniref:hypothetical protein n=1 Tax=Arthrobacter sp. RIT-PI-e TaxID=1681197 RepID=UPI0006760080|nr:hypothetical protein [Arthrobacter sp. RIT-PI-e]